MKKIVLFLLVVAVALVMLFAGRQEQKTVRVEALPWQVEKLSGDRLEVLDVVLGESSAWAGIQAWNGRPDIGLFESPEGDLRLEAYFGKLKIGRVVDEAGDNSKGQGVFDAYIVARLGVSDDEMRRYYASRLEKKPMPSGSYKYELPEKELGQAHDLPMTELSLIPSTQFPKDVVRQRFGEPDSVRPLTEARELWLYKDKSLAMILDPGDKDILHYVTPSRYELLVSRLNNKAKQDIEEAK